MVVQRNYRSRRICSVFDRKTVFKALINVVCFQIQTRLAKAVKQSKLSLKLNQFIQGISEISKSIETADS